MPTGHAHYLGHTHIATPTLGIGLALYYDVMSLVTIFSNQNYVVSAKLAESAKSPGDDSTYMLLATMCRYLDQQGTLTRR